MNRLYMPIFVLFLLLAQWGSFDHAYHMHDSGDVCDYCLTAQALDHAATPTIQLVFVPSYHLTRAEQAWGYVSINRARYFEARAPPRFI